MSARASYGIDAPGAPIGLAAGGVALIVVSVGAGVLELGCGRGAVLVSAAHRLSTLSLAAVTHRPLGWRFWYGGPRMAARLVTAKKPGG